jgi:5'-phosphate synthase pdxT subunit
MGLRRPRVGVLAVQGAVSEHVAALAAVGADGVPVRQPGDLAGIEGLVIPGGESTTFGLVAGRSGLLAGLRDLVANDTVPVLGTCAGMIMLASRAEGTGAQPLVGGMDITVRRNAFGRQVASFEAPVTVAGLGPEPVPGVFIRAPWIEVAGPGVEVLATHAGHGVAARQGRLLVCAFHPELTGDRRVHELFVRGVRESGEAVHDQGGMRVGAQ